MRKFIVILFITNCFFVDFQAQIPNYKKYQSFDLYTLKGIPSSKLSHTKPNVFVKGEGTDTVSVIVSKIKNDTLNFINRGGYWDCLKVIPPKVRIKKDCKCKNDSNFYEQFIYNDTILTYHYTSTKGNRKNGSSLYVNTKRNLIILEFNITKDTRISKDSTFYDLKFLASNYKSLFLYDYKEYNRYIPKTYSFYNKVFDDSTLKFYEKQEKDSVYELGCLRYVWILNGLGEFDTGEGLNIKRIKEVSNTENECK